MESFRDITSIYKKYHPQSCPCGLSANAFCDDYHQHETSFTPERAKDILLISKIPKEQPDYLNLVKKHFLILVQRFHPDKNDKQVESTCN